MATLVSVHDSTMMWENLEYARLQVRLLKNNSARMTKSMQINGNVYNIHIEEEYPCEFGGQCKCQYNHYASADIVASSVSFVERTMFSENSCDEEGTQGEREERRSEGDEEGGVESSVNVR